MFRWLQEKDGKAIGRRQKAPKNVGNRLLPESAISGELRVGPRVCFSALLEGNKEHPKTQHPENAGFLNNQRSAFSGSAFSGASYPTPPKLLMAEASLHNFYVLTPKTLPQTICMYSSTPPF